MMNGFCKTIKQGQKFNFFTNCASTQTILQRELAINSCLAHGKDENVYRKTTI